MEKKKTKTKKTKMMTDVYNKQFIPGHFLVKAMSGGNL